MGRRVRLSLFVALLVLGGSLPGLANQAMPQFLPVDVPGTNIVFMNVRVAHPGLTLHETRAIVWKRLVDVFAQAVEDGARIDGRSVEVEAVQGGDPRILVAGQLIVSVDATHAAINGTTQLELAAIWAANLARGARSVGGDTRDVRRGFWGLRPFERV